MKSSSSSIAGRAVLAVILMVGFYLLAVAISLGLLYIPYAELVYAHRLHLKLGLGCLLGALAILWSVLPRFDKFEAPGPGLTREKHPRLFADIESVSKAVGQEMPAEVYLVPDVNAWVAQRGGIMAFGSRRVMGLGLALMRVLTRSQFRAVLAHEFGHYYGGDTKLGPWVYKTRAAIGRTLGSLGGEKGEGSLLQLPFLWYSKMFLRITHAVSRKQEFQADELAARVVGAKPLADGLRTVHGVGPAYQAYWASECAPVLNAFFQPPLVEGFGQFVHAGSISSLISQTIEEELKSGKTDPYDTHPPLKERLAAIADLPPGAVPADDPLALSLLEDLPELENGMLAAMAGEREAAKLARVGWDEVCGKVYVPQWTELVKANKAALEGLTVEALSQPATNLKAFAQTCFDASGSKAPEGEAEGLASAVLGAALMLCLLRAGGAAETGPGKPVTVRFPTRTLEPFAVPGDLATGKLSAEAWQAQCAEIGAKGLELQLPA